MLENYLPILIFLSVALALGLLMLSLGFLFGRGSKTEAKLSPYECGFDPFEDARIPFDVRYYLVAILFIIISLVSSFFSIMIITGMLELTNTYRALLGLGVIIVFLSLYINTKIKRHEN